MRYKNLVLGLLALMFLTAPSWSLEGVLASPENVQRLKDDLRAGKIKVGQTRLKEILENYGLPTSITDTDKTIVYEYGDLKIEFSRERYWRDWEYDSFKKPAYSDNIDDLRKDLESEELVGDYITIKKIRKDYEEPTEIEETQDDGEASIYYYGRNH